jgi:prepilin-type processing-associated H-X9-DG protein
MLNHVTAKGTLPGYIQPVTRDSSTAGKRYLLWTGTGLADSAYTSTAAFGPNDRHASRVSWAAILLPRLDRNDIWQRMTDGSILDEAVRPIEVFICPVDQDARSSPENAGLSYIVNTGAWDWDGEGVGDYLQPGNNIGDTLANGLFHNLTDGKTTSKLDPNDGSGTTIMISENISKDPSYSWLGVRGDDTTYPGANQLGEQQFGMVWVVAVSPQPGITNVNQEGLGKESTTVFNPNRPWFARPASNHPTGSINVVFADAHVTSIQPTIDYMVYQALLTPNGRKCVNPEDHTANLMPPNGDILLFRTAPPLSEKDFAE